jgi:hypothetical protein
MCCAKVIRSQREYFNPDQPTMIKWTEPIFYELEDLLYWDEYLNGKKTTIHKYAYSFFHSLLLSEFTDYNNGK